MILLADTGVLLRLLDPADPEHGHADRSVSTLETNGDIIVASLQNLAEFWKVCTRPKPARGGLGLDVAEATRRLTILESMFGLIWELPSTQANWRHLVTTHSVKGKQVHDARLVALVLPHGNDPILTFNTADFVRYPGPTAIDPRVY